MNGVNFTLNLKRFGNFTLKCVTLNWNSVFAKKKERHPINVTEQSIQATFEINTKK